MKLRSANVLLILCCGFGIRPDLALAQLQPYEFGQIVNGFQDDFIALARDSRWLAAPPRDAYEQKNGVLEVNVLAGDPNHLLYAAPGYHPTTQEVLARIRVREFAGGSQGRVGIGVGVDPETSQGVNLLFADFEPGNPFANGREGRQFKLLNDVRAWGPAGLPLQWREHTWYWLRLSQTGDSPAQGANIRAKAWPADGNVPEPADWSMRWSQEGRAGLAGILAGSGGLSHFEVDYILIKAGGLPAITAGPRLILLNEPQDHVVRNSQAVTFDVATSGSSPPSFQWQKAVPETAEFIAIPGATAPHFTTPPLAEADNGEKYRCLVSVAEGRVATREATVRIDATKPTLLSARTLGNPNRVRIVFSEPVLVPVNPLCFALDNGVQVTAVEPGAGSNMVEVVTTAIGPKQTYTLTASGIQDLAGNEIVPNATIAIDLSVAVPSEFGQTIACFQDDFSGAVRDPHWRSVPTDKDGYTQTNGLLEVSAKGGDVSHLLYIGPGCQAATQEVLTRIRVNVFPAHRKACAGIGLGIDAETGEGLNLSFRDGNQSGVFGRQITLLDDRLGWGPPVLDIPWANRVWYWLRLRQAGSRAPGQANIHCKFWKADGTVPEPPDWQFHWEQTARTGCAGILGPNATVPAEFEIDYILLKAEGLPQTKVSCGAFALIPGQR